MTEQLTQITLTRTMCSTAHKASVAGTHVTTKGVGAGSIDMAYTGVGFTLIHVWRKDNIYPVTLAETQKIYCKNNCFSDIQLNEHLSHTCTFQATDVLEATQTLAHETAFSVDAH